MEESWELKHADLVSLMGSELLFPLRDRGVDTQRHVSPGARPRLGACAPSTVVSAGRLGSSCRRAELGPHRRLRSLCRASRPHGSWISRPGACVSHPLPTALPSVSRQSILRVCESVSALFSFAWFGLDSPGMGLTHDLVSSVRLVSLSTVPSRSPHVAAKANVILYFMAESCSCV